LKNSNWIFLLFPIAILPLFFRISARADRHTRSRASVIMPQVHSGQSAAPCRCERRSRALALDVPTVAEAGFPELRMDGVVIFGKRGNARRVCATGFHPMYAPSQTSPHS